MGDYEHLLVKQDGDTVRITMNRPERRNSLTEAHLRELLDAFETAGRSDATGIVLAGEGKAFSAGHDFADVAARDLAGVRDLLRLCTRLMRTIEAVPQVVIARVHAIGHRRGLPARRLLRPRRGRRVGVVRAAGRQGRLVLPHARGARWRATSAASG